MIGTEVRLFSEVLSHIRFRGINTIESTRGELWVRAWVAFCTPKSFRVNKMESTEISTQLKLETSQPIAPDNSSSNLLSLPESSGRLSVK